AAVGTWYTRILEGLADHLGFSLETPFRDLTEEQQQAVLYGTGDTVLQRRFTNQCGRTQHYDTKYEGVVKNVPRRFKETDSDYVRTEIEKYMAHIPRAARKGKRLRPEALGVLIDNRDVTTVTHLSSVDALEWADHLASDATPLDNRG